ncbi:hypothetical protein FHR84_002581 [Actinopolyspora biskrensis]|uniref:Uncharacterized protein n=1 Tax=Actinopolyspora biskrensis TaxID=1470178 RepID=A0A852Z9M9_9ACTN|nr:hypothetical protein [Actinopolyspora biskrensis]NYH79247.1 hypothetical protein [Actinopolyspora biskrensis]
MVSDAVRLRDRLVEAARVGELLDVSEESDRKVPAAAIRALLFGLDADELDPRGVRLRGAHVTGQLELTDVRAAVPLVLSRCEFDEGVAAVRAQLPHLDLSGSRFPHLDADDSGCEHDVRLHGVRCEWVSLVDANLAGDLTLHGAWLAASDTPALDLSGATIGGDLCLDDEFTASSESHGGALRLLRATIGDTLSLSRARLTATNGPALHADNLTVGNNLFLGDGFTANSGSSDGTLRLPGGSIAGEFSMSEARLTATNGSALFADGLRVSNGLFLRKGFLTSSDSQIGTLRLSGASIAGQLSLNGAQLTATNGPALHADGLALEGDLFLSDEFTASSDSRLGTIRLPGAHIAGQLSLSGAQLTATNGPALNVEYFKVDNSAFLDEGFTASSDGEDTVRLIGASITGQLALRGAELTATNGAALNADGLTVGSSLSLNEGFTASSDSQIGTLRLNGASITWQLSLSGAQLTATNGAALHAERITVGNNVFLNEGFTASSDSSDGVLRLFGGQIAGQLSMRGTQLTATNGPALHADNLTVGNNVFLNEGFTASSDSNGSTLYLDGANVSGDLFVELVSVSNTGQEGLVLDLQSAQISGDVVLPLAEALAESGQEWGVDVDGLRYPFIPRAGTYRQWLRLLSTHTTAYAPQPYQQLAGVYRAAGHDREAREILIAQQRDLRRRGELDGWFRRLLHRLSGAFIGHGHRPFRALGYLAGLCATTVGLVLLAGALGLAVRAHPNTGPCSMAESIGLGIDTAVPLLKTGGGKRCEIATTTGWGQTLYLGKYLLTTLGWAFATLFVAGYTGLVRRNT